MERKIQRVNRIHTIMNLMWSLQLRRVTLLESDVRLLNNAELQTHHHFNQTIPAELSVLRLRELNKKRLQLEEEASTETIKAKALGLKLKRIEKLITKNDSHP